MSGGTMSDKGWVLAAIDDCTDRVRSREAYAALERLLAPKTPAADARELAIKVREHTFRATPDGTEIVGHVIVLDEAAALIESFVADRVKVALSEAADRAEHYLNSFERDWKVTGKEVVAKHAEGLRAAIMGGKGEGG